MAKRQHCCCSLTSFFGAGALRFLSELFLILILLLLLILILIIITITITIIIIIIKTSCSWSHRLNHQPVEALGSCQPP
jgi:sterol desaturase/sphingolipid hydroxylase (fatty acid hydroxylase superfamily)